MFSSVIVLAYHSLLSCPVLCGPSPLPLSRARLSLSLSHHPLSNARTYIYTQSGIDSKEATSWTNASGLTVLAKPEGKKRRADEDADSASASGSGGAAAAEAAAGGGEAAVVAAAAAYGPGRRSGRVRKANTEARAAKEAAKSKKRGSGELNTPNGRYKKGYQCACGSNTHSRVTHSDCPRNKKRKIQTVPTASPLPRPTSGGGAGATPSTPVQASRPATAPTTTIETLTVPGVNLATLQMLLSLVAKKKEEEENDIIEEGNGENGEP